MSCQAFEHPFDKFHLQLLHFLFWSFLVFFRSIQSFYESTLNPVKHLFPANSVVRALQKRMDALNRDQRLIDPTWHEWTD